MKIPIDPIEIEPQGRKATAENSGEAKKTRIRKSRGSKGPNRKRPGTDIIISNATESLSLMYATTRGDRYTFMASCAVLWIAVAGSLLYVLAKADEGQLLAVSGIIVGSASGAAISIFTKRIMSIWDDCFEILQQCINTLSTHQAKLYAFNASIVFVSELIKLERRFFLIINALTALMLAAAIIYMVTLPRAGSIELAKVAAIIVGALGSGAVAITTNQILRVWRSYSRQLKALVSENSP